MGVQLPLGVVRLANSALQPSLLLDADKRSLLVIDHVPVIRRVSRSPRLVGEQGFGVIQAESALRTRPVRVAGADQAGLVSVDHRVRPISQPELG